jgi:23S rRNA pseudouridine1911/1915/1917 synthase
MGSWHDIVADRGDRGIRLDRVLLRHLLHQPGVTRNRIQRLIACGAVRINGRVAERSSARVAFGDLIAIELPDRAPRTGPLAEPGPLDVRFEDDHLLIVNKPAGQVSHPAFRHSSGTLLNVLLAHANQAWTPALVGRLDKGTSGLMLVAKSRAVQTALQRVGAQQSIEKDYLAIVAGRPPAKGTIDFALDRDPWDRRRVSVRDRGGVPSVTRFERLRTGLIGDRHQLALVRCRLVTGRMHQLRVHLAASGWPIVGDPVYGAGGSGGPTFNMTRQALHAWRIAFPHPYRGVWVEVATDPPADMQQLLEALGMQSA